MRFTQVINPKKIIINETNIRYIHTFKHIFSWFLRFKKKCLLATSN